MNLNNFMKESKVPMNLNGYPLLKRAIDISIRNPNYKMGHIYSMLSMEFNVPYTSVDRNIRTAINKGYPLMDEKLKENIFYGKEKVTAAEYIKSVSYAIRENLI